VQQKNRLRDMTTGSPAKHLFAFAIPLLVGSFLQQFYNMVDSWVVGRFVGDGALAAVGVGAPVIFMFSSLFMGLSTGGTVIIAQFYGAKKPDRVRDAVDTIYTAFIVGAVPLTVLAVALVDPILFLMRVEESAYHEAWVYLLIISIGLMGSIGYNLNSGILSGLGNSRSTLLFLAISTVMNIVLDLVMVIVFHWGVAGAAIATIISQFFSWLFGLGYINRHYPEIAIRPFCRRFDKQLFKKIMGIGLPAGLQMSMVALGALVVTSKVSSFGKEFTAGFNVAHRLDQMAFLPVQSLSNAITAYVGQNMGAGRLDRVRTGIRITVASAVGWALAMLVLIPLSPYLIGFFSKTPEVIYAGVCYLQGIMPFYALFAVMFSLNNAMRGAGDSAFPMVNALLSLILVRVPAVYLIADHFGPQYMFLGFGIGWMLGFTLSVTHYFRGRWKRKGSLAEEKDTPPKIDGE